MMRLGIHRILILTALLIVGNARGQDYTGWAAGEVAGGSGTIMYTADSGNSWIRQGVGQLTNAGLSGIKAVDPETAWAVGLPDSSGYATIYQTTDAGVNWIRRGNGQAALAKAELRKVQTAGPDNIWAAGSYIDGGITYGVIAHSADGGATWENQYPSTLPGNELQGLYTHDGQHIWATGTPQDGYALVLHSDDGGQSWTRQVGGDIVNWTHINGLSAANHSQIWAIPGVEIGGSAGNGIIYSSDGGTNWSRQTDAFGGLYDGNEIDVVDSQVIWAVNDTDILRTTNGGADWEASGQNATYIMGVCGASEREAWAVLHGEEFLGGQLAEFGAIYHTTDGGQTWSTFGGSESEIAPLWTIDMVAIPEPGGLALAIMGSLLVVFLFKRFVYLM